MLLGNISTVLALIIGLVVLWVVASVPIYFSSKLLVHDRSEFGRALTATFVAAFIFVIFSIVFVPFIPIFGALVGFVLILLVLLPVYRIGLARAFVLAVVAFVVFVVLSLLLALLGIFVHLVLL